MRHFNINYHSFSIASFALVLGANLLPLGNQALAHHPLSGEKMTSLWHGLLSGIGHPIIGLDHLAFIIGVALVARMMVKKWQAPLAFIGATLAGALVLNQITIPFMELMIAASVLLVGIGLVAAKGKNNSTMVATVIGLAGLLHGAAYGGAIIGVEPTPIIGYLVSFAVTQFVIMLVAAKVMDYFIAKSKASYDLMPVKLAGSAIFGIGFVYIFEHAESMLLG